MLYFLWIDIYSLHRFWSGPYPWCTIMRTKNIKKSKRNLSSLSWISCTSAIMSYTLIYWRICLSLFKYLESHPSPSSRISMNWTRWKDFTSNPQTSPWMPFWMFPCTFQRIAFKLPRPLQVSPTCLLVDGLVQSYVSYYLPTMDSRQLLLKNIIDLFSLLFSDDCIALTTFPYTWSLNCYSLLLTGIHTCYQPLWIPVCSSLHYSSSSSISPALLPCLLINNFIVFEYS